MRYYLRKFNQEKLRSVSSSSASSSIASPVASPSPVSAFSATNMPQRKPVGSAVVQLDFDEADFFPDFETKHDDNEFAADKTIINHELERSRTSWFSMAQTPTPKVINIMPNSIRTRSMTRSLVSNRESIDIRLEIDVNVDNQNGKFSIYCIFKRETTQNKPIVYKF